MITASNLTKRFNEKVAVDSLSFELTGGEVPAPVGTGIRAKLVSTRTGALEMDFVVRGAEDSTHSLNAVSPAWTSALAVAEHVADLM